MPEGTQAFIVFQDGLVVNKIVPVDPVSCYADLQAFYADQSYTINFYPDPNGSDFLSTNA